LTIVPTPAPVKIRFKVNPTPGSHGAGMGSASKGKRIASGSVGGKAKHARIGMSSVHPYYLNNPTSEECGSNDGRSKYLSDDKD